MKPTTRDLRDSMRAAWESVRDDADRRLSVTARFMVDNAVRGLPVRADDFDFAAHADRLEADALFTEWMSLYDIERAAAAVTS